MVDLKEDVDEFKDFLEFLKYMRKLNHAKLILDIEGEKMKNGKDILEKERV